MGTANLFCGKSSFMWKNILRFIGSICPLIANPLIRYSPNREKKWQNIVTGTFQLSPVAYTARNRQCILMNLQRRKCSAYSFLYIQCKLKLYREMNRGAWFIQFKSSTVYKTVYYNCLLVISGIFIPITIGCIVLSFDKWQRKIRFHYNWRLKAPLTYVYLQNFCFMRKDLFYALCIVDRIKVGHSHVTHD
jgi:hypothetical protein